MSKTSKKRELTEEQLAEWRREIRGMSPENFRYEFRAIQEIQPRLLAWATRKQLARLNDYDLEDMLESDDPEVRAAAEAALPKVKTRR